ncbi:MAG: nuclear transport factor 2 family protein [Acidobacteria bacterium]|nr:nuclear transport factor 2 family protein [Acidobacteriota bacterium]
MGRVFLVVVLAAVAAAAAPAARAQTRGAAAARPKLTAEQSVRQFEREFIEARRQARRGNSAPLQRLLSADFIATSLNGRVVNRAQYVRGSSNPNLRFSSFDVDETKVRVYGDSAVVTGRVRITSRAEGGDQTFQFRYTNMYVAAGGGRWQIAASHLTPVATR